MGGFLGVQDGGLGVTTFLSYTQENEGSPKGLGVEVYDLFMFEEGDKRSARKAAIQELILLMQDKSPDDIRFTVSVLRQVLERGKGR